MTYGFIKESFETNEEYLKDYETDPWYPIILDTHGALNHALPGYQIIQIKEKFDGLRYYISYPSEEDFIPGSPFFPTREKAIARAEGIIRYAEAWVDGFEYAKRKNAGGY